jgi:hypothetical protein
MAGHRRLARHRRAGGFGLRRSLSAAAGEGRDGTSGRQGLPPSLLERVPPAWLGWCPCPWCPCPWQAAAASVAPPSLLERVPPAWLGWCPCPWCPCPWQAAAAASVAWSTVCLARLPLLLGCCPCKPGCPCPWPEQWLAHGLAPYKSRRHCRCLSYHVPSPCRAPSLVGSLPSAIDSISPAAAVGPSSRRRQQHGRHRRSRWRGGLRRRQSCSFR